MHSMFNHAGAFNGDLSAWDVRRVTNIYAMFYNVTTFDQKNLCSNGTSWDTTGKVVTYMFSLCCTCEGCADGCA